jgi:2,4-dienoyl-CoA reductase-like NADH-dependent reductase (Old Yellow Enzyme family)
MTNDDLDAVVVAFAAAARRAVDAGFLAIELHYAHGYLVHQFLTPLVNQRSDEYGGDLANRARLAVRIARAVRAEVGESIALFARLSVVDWADGGLTLDDSVVISRWLSEAGVDVIDCSSGAAVIGESVPAAPLYLVGFAERIRADAAVLTAAVGLITDARDADEIIRAGRADITMIGRAMLRDPYWPRAAARALEAVGDPPIPVPYRRAVERMDARTQW